MKFEQMHGEQSVVAPVPSEKPSEGDNEDEREWKAWEKIDKRASEIYKTYREKAVLGDNFGAGRDMARAIVGLSVEDVDVIKKAEDKEHRFIAQIPKGVGDIGRWFEKNNDYSILSGEDMGKRGDSDEVRKAKSEKVMEQVWQTLSQRMAGATEVLLEKGLIQEADQVLVSCDKILKDNFKDVVPYSSRKVRDFIFDSLTSKLTEMRNSPDESERKKAEDFIVANGDRYKF
jgi:hypothetical protein